MSISLKTHKMLWGRAANRCAICNMELVMDASETDDESIVGEACHIVAQSIDGPRGESALTPEQRDQFSNLILLCNVHHKQIDDQPNTYPVSELKRIKLDHEPWEQTSSDLTAKNNKMMKSTQAISNNGNRVYSFLAGTIGPRGYLAMASHL